MGTWQFHSEEGSYFWSLSEACCASKNEHWSLHTDVFLNLTWPTKLLFCVFWYGKWILFSSWQKQKELHMTGWRFFFLFDPKFLPISESLVYVYQCASKATEAKLYTSDEYSKKIDILASCFLAGVHIFCFTSRKTKTITSNTLTDTDTILVRPLTSLLSLIFPP